MLPELMEAPEGLRRFSLRDCALDFRDMNRFRNTEALQDFQQNPGRVKFIPRQSMTRRSRVRMMIVVPALAEGEESNPPVIAGIVASGKTAAAPHVRGRI